ncbi:MAG: AAA family ATPase, partial [Spirochaetaceae bacterium]|nr:AAA family ATPase [Spirochaetaceae bacterium]
KVDPADIRFGITEGEIAALEASASGASFAAPVIGQERAVRAIALGMGIRAKGYNIYVTGLPGTGKRTAVTKILEASRADNASGLRDLVYVNNFRQPEAPLVLSFAAGRGSVFRDALIRLVDNLKNALAGRRTREAALPAIQSQTGELRREFSEPGARTYFDSLEEDLGRNFRLFAEDFSDDPSVEPPAWRYGANLIVDNSAGRTPVIFETFPDYAAIFGNMEPAGEGRSHFMLIRAGSLIRASGGFLILRAEDIVSEEDAWNSLKRALENGFAEIRAVPNPFYPAAAGLKPEAIRIDTKVVVMGNENTYDALYHTDEDFSKLFKVHAEFDCVMDRDERGMSEYLGFIRGICAEEKLPEFRPAASAAVLEYGARMSELRSKLTTRFSLIADLVREASHWARRGGKDSVERCDVGRALEERRFLAGLPERKIDEQILCGEILMSLTGRETGRINGLGIIDRGYYAFGRPLVITARASPGHDGIVNIERESGLSGEIHDKGILIIEGYLRALYATDFPLSLWASICFEQSYMEVDGDSAAAAEICALLSALADAPLRQDLALTGSINQMGEVQPVGGVSEKIEGFYEVCRKTGLTGTQGVIIPRLNMDSLVLTESAQAALREGSFHLYAVSTVDQGMEILTGLPAGRKNGQGAFPANSLNSKVHRRLREMAKLVKDFGGN